VIIEEPSHSVNEKMHDALFRIRESADDLNPVITHLRIEVNPSALSILSDSLEIAFSSHSVK
jgi:hypothetical protein